MTDIPLAPVLELDIEEFEPFELLTLNRQGETPGRMLTSHALKERFENFGIVKVRPADPEFHRQLLWSSNNLKNYAGRSMSPSSMESLVGAKKARGSATALNDNNGKDTRSLRSLGPAQPPLSTVYLPPEIMTKKIQTRIQTIREMNGRIRTRLNFMDGLIRFHQQYAPQTPLTRQPKIGQNQSVDLFELKKCVERRGGYVNIHRRVDQWKQVASDLGLKMVQTYTVYYQLKLLYEKWIYPYDLFLKAFASPVTATSKPTRRKQAEAVKETVASRPKRQGQRELNYCEGGDVMPDNRKRRVSKRHSGASFDSDDDEDSHTKKSHESVPERSSESIQIPSIMRPPVGFKKEQDCEYCFEPVKSTGVTCSGCSAVFHGTCLKEVEYYRPNEEWYCFKCLTPADDFWFQEGPTYTVEEFKWKADQFASEYFGVKDPCVLEDPEVEAEFWHIFNSEKEDEIDVEYGADICSSSFGSGFPDHRQSRHPLTDHAWNLNTLAMRDGSLLRLCDRDVSGMIIPWVYFGMCFSTFCWHAEDHYSYSVNYLHAGATKTWYSIPSSHAHQFEEALRQELPDLFSWHPDLQFHITTLIPIEVVTEKYKIPVYKVHQHPGEFVFTFPHAYHAGFNHGFNIAEAVNFCLPDWIDRGRECVHAYSMWKRVPVFSHDALLLKIVKTEHEKFVHMKETSRRRELWESFEFLVDTWQLVHRQLEEMVDRELRSRKLFEQTFGKDSIVLLPADLETDLQSNLCAECKMFCHLSGIRKKDEANLPVFKSRRLATAAEKMQGQRQDTSTFITSCFDHIQKVMGKEHICLVVQVSEEYMKQALVKSKELLDFATRFNEVRVFLSSGSKFSSTTSMDVDMEEEKTLLGHRSSRTKSSTPSTPKSSPKMMNSSPINVKSPSELKRLESWQQDARRAIEARQFDYYQASNLVNEAQRKRWKLPEVHQLSCKVDEYDNWKADMTGFESYSKEKLLELVGRARRIRICSLDFLNCGGDRLVGVLRWLRDFEDLDKSMDRDEADDLLRRGTELNLDRPEFMNLKALYTHPSDHTSSASDIS